jgi:Na+-translocating ferredoxin:NAD+ oxidoreductase RnfG subunit
MPISERFRTKFVWAPALRSRRRRLSVFLAILLAGSVLMAALPAVVCAKVYHARDEALELAFPAAERIEARDVVLTKEQHEKIEKLAKAPLESDLVTIYVGWRSGSPMAYAIFDTHTVRTFPETLLVVLSPDGKVKATHVLAFHEPEEYLTKQRWLDTFNGKELTDELQVGRGISGITGSTLSTQAVTSGIRRALAVWAVVIGGK